LRDIHKNSFFLFGDSGILHDTQRMNVRLSIFLFEHKAHLARDLANSGK